MGVLRKTLLATSLIGAGLLSTTGAALADSQDGAANVDDVQTVTPANVCSLDVPVNILGVQVPVQDVAGNVPIASPTDGHGGSGSGVDKSCGNPTHTDN